LPPKFHSLRVNDLRYVLALGCTAEERARPQEIGVSVELRFEGEPRGVRTDELRDTVCFAELGAAFARHFEGKEYRLIERIAGEVYEIAREVSRGAAVAVKVHKLKPPVANLVGGAVYSCGDFQP
jgi:dihydroneopterin aldolase